MKYKFIIIIFYILSTDQIIDDKISNNLWSVLFVINKYDKFLRHLQNIISLKNENVKIIKSFEQIDDNFNKWLENYKFFALIIWDHKEKKEINHNFGQELAKNLNKINQKIDVLCLDFCYSSNLDLIMDIVDRANFIIANQDRQFLDGFCYDNLLKCSMNKENTTTSSKKIAQEIVLQTCDYYIKTDQFNLINLVAIDCQKIKLLRPFINKFERLKYNQMDMFNIIQKQFYCSHLIKFLIDNIIIAQAKTGNYQSFSGISI